MRAEHFLYFNNSRIYGEDLVPVKCIKAPPGGLGCCPFYGSSVVDDFCLLLLPMWESVIFLCFVVRYFMSILGLQSSCWGRESWLPCLVCLQGIS